MSNEYEIESQKPYFKSVKELLDKYEDGWNVFIKAHHEKSYDIPVPRKAEFANDPYLPDTWLDLADRVIAIIAHEKYGLKTSPNRIEIVRADQMLDAYVKPVPGGLHHWSYGRRRMQEEQQYDASKHLAYEIIINSNPALAYCMDTNTPVMQMLVFAHASYGHNAFYRNNFLFEDFSDPDAIMYVNGRLAELVDACEEKYGIDDVERVLDFCHAMRFMDTSDRLPPKVLTKKEKEQKKAEAEKRALMDTSWRSVFKEHADPDAEKAKLDGLLSHPAKGRRNILRYIADHVPHIPDWKRQIMHMSSMINQHFIPNMRTKVANEGFACITHYQILETLFDIGLIDASMHGEFRMSHAGVTYQPPGSRIVKDPNTGEEKEVFIGSEINIYALGFAIYEDVKRICNEPTDEDREWFPHFAGKGNWEDMALHMMESCDDETLVEQYMSPTVMRKFKYFMLEGKLENEFLEVKAIHADDGFKKIRRQLAADYRMSDKIPKISLADHQEETDRCLVLRHDVINGQMLEPKSLQQILEMIHYQTKHPVVVESVNESGDVIASYSSPPDYQHIPHQRREPHYTYGR